MRRLFSTFAHGAPGIGLLLIRLVAGTALLARGMPAVAQASAFRPSLWHAFSCALGVLLLAGLWTPIAGVLAALCALGSAFADPGDGWYWIGTGTLGLALALLGPGAWSVDARLFGWKRLNIPHAKRPEPPPF